MQLLNINFKIIVQSLTVYFYEVYTIREICPYNPTAIQLFPKGSWLTVTEADQL